MKEDSKIFEQPSERGAICYNEDTIGVGAGLAESTKSGVYFLDTLNWRC